MAKEFTPIRRCRHCGNKTHRKWWADNKICPICCLAKEYVESAHGGLPVQQIEELRIEASKMAESLQR